MSNKFKHSVNRNQTKPVTEDKEDKVVTTGTVEPTETETKSETEGADTSTEEQKITEEVKTPTEDKPEIKETPKATEKLKEGLDADSKLDEDGIREAFKTPNKTIAEKLEIVATKAITKYAVVAGKVVSYNENMSSFIEPKTGVRTQYDLYQTLVSVINEKDYNAFKTKFDIVNFAFVAYKDEAFKFTSLFRYQEAWSWSKTELNNFNNLLNVISLLADLATRDANKVKVDIKTALSGTSVKFTNVAKNNIKKYYNV